MSAILNLGTNPGIVTSTSGFGSNLVRRFLGDLKGREKGGFQTRAKMRARMGDEHEINKDENEHSRNRAAMSMQIGI